MNVSTRNILLTGWVAAGLVFIAWNVVSYQAHDLPKDTLTTTNTVEVSEADDFIAFKAKTSHRQTVLFFPGALVDPNAYASLARHLAEEGYSTYIIKMPWRMASYGYKTIDALFDLTDTSKQYVLCGHSQGGKMAAQFVYENPNKLAGLILIGTSHPREIDLSTIRIPVMKLCASNDDLASLDEVDRNKRKLPADTDFVLIKGGNHAQFGYYGMQLSDDNATISRVEQQQLTEQAILRFLKKI